MTPRNWGYRTWITPASSSGNSGPSSTRWPVSSSPGGASHGVRVVAIHPPQDIPQWVGSDRHIAQNGMEVVDLGWDAKQKRLRGTLRLVGSFPLPCFSGCPIHIALNGQRAKRHRAALSRRATCLRLPCNGRNRAKPTSISSSPLHSRFVIARSFNFQSEDLRLFCGDTSCAVRVKKKSCLRRSRTFALSLTRLIDQEVQFQVKRYRNGLLSLCCFN